MSTIPPIVIDLQLKNIGRVASGFRSIIDTIQRNEKLATRTTDRETELRARLVEKSVKRQIAAYQQLQAAALKAGSMPPPPSFKVPYIPRSGPQAGSATGLGSYKQPLALRPSTGPQLPAVVRPVTGPHQPHDAAGVAGKVSGSSGLSAAEKEAAAKQKILDREARDKIAAMKSADKIIAQAKAQGLKESERIAREDVRATEKAEHDKEQAALKWLHQREKEEAASAQKRQALGRTLMGAGGAALNTGKSATMGGLRVLTNLGGGFDVADAIQQRMAAQGKAADIANSGFIAGDAKNGTKRSSDELMRVATSAGQPFAFSQDQTLEGLGKFTAKTGDLSTGMQMLPKLAELARATGSSFDDLADASADVFNTDTNQSAEDVMKTMRIITAQGKLGAVEIKDLASQMAKLGAAAGQFGGKASDNLTEFGAITQVTRAKGGAASATQAATSVASFANTFSKGARLDAFEHMGVKVRDPKGALFSPEKIITDSLQAAEKHGGMGQFDRNMGKMFMDVRARSATKGFEKTYKDAGGGEAGAKAVHAEFEKFRKAQSEKEVSEAAASRMQEADVQFEKVILQFRDAAAKDLIPAVTALIPSLVKLTPIIGDLAKEAAGFANFLSSHPLAGMGVIMGASFAKEMASAGLSKILESALATKLGSGGGLAVATAAIAITGAMIAIEKLAADDNATVAKGVANTAEATNDIVDLKHAKTPEEKKQLLAKAQDDAAALKANIKEQEENKGGNKWLRYAAKAGAGIADVATLGVAGATKRVDKEQAAREITDQAAIDRQKDDLAKLNAAMSAASKGLNELAGAAGSATAAKTSSANPNRTQTAIKRSTQ